VARLVDALREAPPQERPQLGQGALRMLERMFGIRMVGLEESRARATIPPDPLEQRTRAIDALRALLAGVGERRPLLLWIDDYQWADLDSQQLISALLRGSEPLRVLFVLSEDMPQDYLHSPLPGAHEVIAVTSLTPQAARALGAQLGERAARSGPALHAPYYRDASPLLIQERVRYALSFGEPAADLELPALIEARVRMLPNEARRVLEIVCACYDPLPQEVCERASGLSRAAFSRQLAALRIGAMVRSFSAGGEDLLAPSHRLVADALESRVQLARPQIHAMVAGALSAREQSRASARLLRHQQESGDLRSAAASTLAAAQEAERALSFQRCAELLALGAALQPASRDEAGAQLLARLGEAYSNAGWSLAAAGVYREAAQLAKGADPIHMHQRSIEHYLRAAEHGQGLEALDELLGSFGLMMAKSSRGAFLSLLARRALVRLRGYGFRESSEGQVPVSELRYIDALWSTGVRLVMVDMMRGAELLARAMSAALQAGEPQRVARSLCTEAWMLLGYKRGHIARLERIVESARRLVERQPAPLLDGHLRLAEAMLAVGRFALPEAYAHFRDAELVLRAECTDVAWEVRMSQVYQVIALTQLGRFAEVAIKYESSTHEARERGDLWGHAQLKTIGAVGVKLVRDLPNEAAEELREAVVHWEDSRDLHLQHVTSLLASTYIDLYRGSPRALDGLEEKWPRLKRNFFLFVRFPRTNLLELRGRAQILVAKRQKDPALLRGAEADARALLSQDEGPEHGLARMLLAGVAAQRGQQERALELLRASINDLETHGLELWSLPGRYVLGRLLGGDAGRELRAQARDTLLTRGVVNVGRMVAAMLPGFEGE
jgi:hypothetical protein